MAATWPDWRLVQYRDGVAEWRGVIRPNSRKYDVSLRFKMPLSDDAYDPMQGQPRVRILAPSLELHWDYEEGPLPHVYRVGESMDHFILCLFSIEGEEWNPNDLLAETTLKWASLWLNFYEGWLATKRWYGGGRHVSSAVSQREIKRVANG